jgi:nucleoside phosphorylase
MGEQAESPAAGGVNELAVLDVVVAQTVVDEQAAMVEREPEEVYEPGERHDA